MKKIKIRQMNMIVAAGLIIVITIVIALAITASNTANNKSQDTVAVIKSKADAMKAQAIEAFMNKNLNRAKTLFQQAQQKYKDIGDTNNVVDTAAQLYLIEHSSTAK